VTRLIVLFAMLATAAPAQTGTSTSASMSPPSAALSALPPRAQRIWREAIVIDTHNDLPTKILDERYDPDVRHAATEGHTDLPRLTESGLTAVFLSAWVDAPYAERTPDGSYQRALAYCDAIHAFVARHPDRLLFATTSADVERAKREGKVAIFIGVEGGHAIQSSLDSLRTLYARGARYMTLTWNNGNAWAGSSIGSNGTRTGGLTDFGKDVVREMNRIGMLVDLSHVSEQTFYDAIAVSRSPVIASHSSARALADHPRNLTDDQLRAIARNGGVVNVNFYPRFIDSTYRKAVDAAEAKAQAYGDSLRAAPGFDAAKAKALEDARRSELVAQIPVTPLSVLVDHIDHIAKVAGVDHVGIGSDFDGIPVAPVGMEDVTALPRLTQALLDRGYSDADVTKMLGGNMMRVMRLVLDRRQASN